MTEVDIEAGFTAAARFWWVFLVAGIAWIIFAIMVFRFDWRSVAAISVLFGIVVIVAAVDELFTAFAAEQSGWARAGRLALAVAFFVIGVVAFVHPGNTFAALAAVMSFYFVLKRILDMGLAIARRHSADLWWVYFLVGVAELLIGFWAAGDFGNKTILLVVWVGVMALMRGISAITFAFAARELR